MDSANNVVSFETKKRFFARRFKKPINRRTKVNLVFDESSRTEYLSGFRKRNQERRKRNEHRLNLKVKEEKKRIKSGAKESYKKLVKSFEPIPEIEELLQEEHDLPNHSVSILELNTEDIARENCWIGKNKVCYEDDNDKKDKSDDDEDDDNKIDISGMSLKSEKDVKKLIMKQSAELVKNSRIYKQKNRVESIKNKKRAQTKKKLEKVERKVKNIKTKRKNLKKKKK